MDTKLTGEVPDAHVAQQPEQKTGDSYAFDEYKFFAQATEHLADRRQGLSQNYLTINTAIFTVVTFLFSQIKADRWGLVLVSLPLMLVGILVCLIWLRLIFQYRRLISWRYEQLINIEKTAIKHQSHQFFTKERGDFLAKNVASRFGFTALEAGLPVLLLALYSIYGGILVVIAALQL